MKEYYIFECSTINFHTGYINSHELWSYDKEYECWESIAIKPFNTGKWSVISKIDSNSQTWTPYADGSKIRRALNQDEKEFLFLLKL